MQIVRVTAHGKEKNDPMSDKHISVAVEDGCAVIRLKSDGEDEKGRYSVLDLEQVSKTVNALKTAMRRLTDEDAEPVRSDLEVIFRANLLERDTELQAKLMVDARKMQLFMWRMAEDLRSYRKKLENEAELVNRVPSVSGERLSEYAEQLPDLRVKVCQCIIDAYHELLEEMGLRYVVDECE